MVEWNIGMTFVTQWVGTEGKHILYFTQDFFEKMGNQLLPLTHLDPNQHWQTVPLPAIKLLCRVC